MICCPNDFNLFQDIAVKEYSLKEWFFAPPEHLNYFSYETLANLLKAKGYEIVHREATFPIDLFLLMGDIYIGNSELGSQSHNRRVNFETNMIKSGNAAKLRDLYQKFAELGLGREILMLAKKV